MCFIHVWATRSSTARRSLVLAATAQDTCTACCNETDLGTRRCLTGHCGGVANVLMVTSSVRVLNRVHCRTADPWPAIALHPVLVEVVSGLEHWLVHAAATCNDANHAAAC